MTGQRLLPLSVDVLPAWGLLTREALREVVRFYDSRKVGERGPLGFRKSTRLEVLWIGLERLMEEGLLQPGRSRFLDLGCADGRVNVFFSYLVRCSVGIELDNWTLEEYGPLRAELDKRLLMKGLPLPPGNIVLFSGDAQAEETYERLRRSTGCSFEAFDLFYSFQPLQAELAELIRRRARPGAVWLAYGLGEILPRFPGFVVLNRGKALGGDSGHISKNNDGRQRIKGGERKGYMNENENRLERNTRTALEYLSDIAAGSGGEGKAAFDRAFAKVAEDFEIEILPSSLKMPKMKRDPYRAWLEPLVKDLFVSFEAHIVNTTAQDHRVVIEAFSRAKTKDGRDYGQEYFLAFEFNEAGKIRKVKEFTDSLYTSRFYNPKDRPT